MRFLTITMLLSICFCISDGQGSGWTLTLSDHRTIDSLILKAVSKDSLRVLRNGTSLAISINDVVRLKEPHRSKLLTGALLGGIIGFAAFETSFELDEDRGELRGRDIWIFPFVPINAIGHIGFDVIGIMAGTTIGVVGGLMVDKGQVYEFSNLAQTAKIDLLESILENEDNPYIE